MKQKLLVLLCSAFVLVGKSQTLLNETYSETPINYDEGRVKLNRKEQSGLVVPKMERTGKRY